MASDLIYGVRGKIYFHGSRFYVPYYADFGNSLGSISNFTNEAYTGIGYTYEHGQSLLLAWRTLNFGGFPSNAPVQSLNFNGPLLGYSMSL